MHEPKAPNDIATLLDYYWAIDAKKYNDPLRLYADPHFPYGKYEIPAKPTIMVANDYSILFESTWGYGAVRYGTPTRLYGGAVYPYGYYLESYASDVSQLNNVFRFDLDNLGDAIIIRLAPAGWSEEFLGYPLEYKRQRVNVQIELYTKESRERLYNLYREVRRICYAFRKRVFWRLDHGAATGTFLNYEKITGTVGGATANLDGSGGDTFKLISNWKKFFEEGELFTGDVSGASAIALRTQYSWWHLLRWRSFNENTESTFNNWQGVCQITLENDGRPIVEGYSE